LGEVTHSIRTGLNPRNNFKLNTPGATNYYVTVKEITTGKILFSDKTDKIDDDALKIIQKRSNLELGDVLFSGIGTIGKVALVDIEPKNWNCSESVFILKPKKDILIPKYLVYILQSNSLTSQFLKQSVGSTLQGVRMSTLSNISIPLPPLPVQEEIVRILDKFTEHIQLLERELELRHKQYEYYRNKLLTPTEEKGSWLLNGHPVEWKTLGEVAQIIRGVTYSKSQEAKDKVGFKVLRANNLILANNRINFDDVKIISNTVKVKDEQKLRKNDIFICTASGSKEHIGKVAFIDENLDYYFGGFMAVIRTENIIMSKFLFYLLVGENFSKYLKNSLNTSTINNLNTTILQNFRIPIPPMEEQERIVAILDKFDALVNDISQGLPAEIQARKKQYEYYRNKLLTFKEKDS
jgi:type I restriction enzyme S subunit